MSKDDKEFEHINVPFHLQPQLRLYRRLIISSVDIEEAKATVQELTDRRIALPKNGIPNGLLMALTTALVVSYSRPFINSRGQSEIADKTVPAILLKSFTSKERSIHEEILSIRNKEVAHADVDILEISIKLHEGGHSAIFRNVRSPFTHSELKLILKMIEKLKQSFDSRCEELRTQLPLDAWM